MPIYEYKCSECGNVYEKRQKFSDTPDSECSCEKKASVFRVTSVPALVFKGSGWYINDYARAGKDGVKGGAPKDGGAANGSSAATDSGSAANSDAGSTSKADSGSGAANTSDSGSKPDPATKP